TASRSAGRAAAPPRSRSSPEWPAAPPPAPAPARPAHEWNRSAWGREKRVSPTPTSLLEEPRRPLPPGKRTFPPGTEDPVAPAGDEAVAGVPQSCREDREDGRQKSARAANRAQRGDDPVGPQPEVRPLAPRPVGDEDE